MRSVVRQLGAEERWRAAAAAYQSGRAEWEADRAAREADRVHREAAGLHREALREAVTRYVLRLKWTGVPPERVLVLVKTLVADTARSADPPLHEAGALTHDVVRWSLDAYYAAA